MRQVLVFPLSLAACWNPTRWPTRAANYDRARAPFYPTAQLFAMFFPLLSIMMAIGIARAHGHGVVAAGVVVISFLSTTGRHLLIHQQLRQSENSYRLLFEEKQEAEQRYRAIFENNSIAMVQSSTDGRYLHVNPAFARMFGYQSPEEVVACVRPRQLYVDDACRCELSRELRERGEFDNREFQVYRRDGSKFWVRGHARAVRGTDGHPLYYVGTAEDVTARRTADEQVQFLAYYDALTGLPNRTLLQDRLSKALASARRRNEKVAVLFLDLDQFKTINDSLGHSFGDQLLWEVGERLKGWARAQDTVARIGGDEFAIALTGINGIPDAAVATERIMDAMTREFVVQGRQFNVSCSIGISICPDHGVSGETLLKNADLAMYCAKESGRNAFRFFSEDMHAQVVERLNIEHDLRLALERNELFLMYQPQTDLATETIIGMEALLRWRHPEMGLVPPDRFIRVAENSGLILSIGEWVLQAACSAARRWQDEGLAVPVAVNVSAVQFRQTRFRDLVRSVLRDRGLAPDLLELELTESLLLSNGDLTCARLREFKAMGVKLAIDDFGTGYSSLSYLRQFPLSKLKIDRSFIMAVPVNADDAAIVAAIISMGRNLNLKVIAEGVENESQVSFLRKHQCDGMQGYYFSKPLLPDEVADKLRSNRTRALSAYHGSK